MPYKDYNIDHLIHHIANFSYTTSLPCKNKLDASNMFVAFITWLLWLR